MNDQQYIEAQDIVFKGLAQGTLDSTVVPFRTSYVNAATCLTILHLISTELAASISRQVLQHLHPHAGPHYWYPLHDLHITIKNVRKAIPGRVFTNDEIRRAIAVVDHSSPKLSPLAFQIHGPICLPTSIVLRAYGSLRSRDAITVLDNELKAAGIPDDKLYASDDVAIWNITLCRFTQEPSPALRKAVVECSEVILGEYSVDAVQLVQCDEVCSTDSRIVFAKQPLSL